MSKRKAETLEEEEQEATLFAVLDTVLSRDFLRWYDAKKLQSTSRQCKQMYDVSPRVRDWDRLYEVLRKSAMPSTCYFCSSPDEDREDEEWRCPCGEIAQRLGRKGTAFKSPSIEKKCERLSTHKARLVSAFRAHFDYQRLNQVVPLDWSVEHHAKLSSLKETCPRRFAFILNVALHSMAANELKVGVCNFGEIFLGRNDGEFTLNRLGLFRIAFLEGQLEMALLPGSDGCIEEVLRSELPPHRDLLGPIYDKTEIMSVFFTGVEHDQIVSVDLEDDTELAREHE